MPSNAALSGAAGRRADPPVRAGPPGPALRIRITLVPTGRPARGPAADRGVRPTITGKGSGIKLGAPIADNKAKTSSGIRAIRISLQFFQQVLGLLEARESLLRLAKLACMDPSP